MQRTSEGGWVASSEYARSMLGQLWKGRWSVSASRMHVMQSMKRVGEKAVMEGVTLSSL